MWSRLFLSIRGHNSGQYGKSFSWIIYVLMANVTVRKQQQQQKPPLCEQPQKNSKEEASSQLVRGSLLINDGG